ncbi:MAG: hypothetical protein OXF32_07150 [Anaerolineaceae bacterium]|nr:hypothetical protein [Anaerolineaceae bacterium]
MSAFASEAEAVTWVFHSLRKLRGQPRPPDDRGRDAAPTRELLQTLGLPSVAREYVVVTGSKGKGSTTAMAARTLQAPGRRVGMLTSPHLVSWRERVRVDGQAIPLADFLRILAWLKPATERIEAHLGPGQYFSPTGLFLALALRWFDEQGVAAAVLEVGRGGRFDDVALAPNALSLVTPVVREHDFWLGPGLARIAWHKAGIIKAGSQVVSLPQAGPVVAELKREAQRQEARLELLTPAQLAQPLARTERGQRLRLAPFGEFDLPLRGRHQAANATLALRAAAHVAARLGVSGDPAAMAARLATLRWPGRLEKLGDSPALYVDGAVHRQSALYALEALGAAVARPLQVVLAVPDDKDYAGVIEALAPASDGLIFCETPRNPILRFPPAEELLALGRAEGARVARVPHLAAALARAQEGAGPEGTVLLCGTHSILADVMLLRGRSFERLWD